MIRDCTCPEILRVLCYSIALIVMLHKCIFFSFSRDPANSLFFAEFLKISILELIGAQEREKKKLIQKIFNILSAYHEKLIRQVFA